MRTVLGVFLYARGGVKLPRSLRRARAHHRRALPGRAANFRAETIGIRRGDAGLAVERALAGKRTLLGLLALAIQRGDAPAVFEVARAGRDAGPLERALG